MSAAATLGRLFLVAAVVFMPALLTASVAKADDPETKPLTVKHCVDFVITGTGDAQPWQSGEWVPMNRRPGGKHDYDARFKMLYSSTGVYVLFDGSDQILTATMDED